MDLSSFVCLPLIFYGKLLQLLLNTFYTTYLIKVPVKAGGRCDSLASDNLPFGTTEAYSQL